jgi:hypothetical protein
MEKIKDGFRLTFVTFVFWLAYIVDARPLFVDCDGLGKIVKCLMSGKYSRTGTGKDMVIVKLHLNDPLGFHTMPACNASIEFALHEDPLSLFDWTARRGSSHRIG